MPSLERFEFLLNSSGDPFGVETELMHKEIGGALHDVAVGNAQREHGRLRVLARKLGEHLFPDTAFDNTVFHRHHETGFGSPTNRLSIEWLHPTHVDDANGQARFLKRSRSLVRRLNHIPERKDSNIGPFPHQARHARLVGFGLVGNGHAARLAARIAHRCGACHLMYRVAEHIVQLLKACRTKYSHSRHSGKIAHIKHALMRFAVVADKPRAVNAEHRVQPEQRHIMDEHIKAPLQEA